MSLITEAMVKDPDSCEFFTIPTNCFHCGERVVSFPMVMWSGESGQIWGHPQCMARLGAALTRDFMESEKGKESANEWYLSVKRTLN